MIWLITLFLVTVACYLTMQGLAERDLIKDNADENDPDKGLFMQISHKINPDFIGDEADMTIAEEDSKFAKAVQSVQRKTISSSERIERKIAASLDNPPDTLFDRSLAKVTALSESVDNKLSRKVDASVSKSIGASVADDDSAVGRMVKKVTNKMKKAEDKLQSKIDRTTQLETGKFADEGGLFARMVSGVSSKLDSVDKRLDKKLEASRSASQDVEALSSNEDFFSRVAGNIGDRVNSADDKIIDATRKYGNSSK